jgi:hypothetical protein
VKSTWCLLGTRPPLWRTTKVRSSFCEAQCVVGASAYFIAIMIILTVVLPMTNRADVALSFSRVDELAARARVRTTTRIFDHVHECFHVATFARDRCGQQADNKILRLANSRLGPVGSHFEELT